MLQQKETWGVGLHYDDSKTDLLTEGGNQLWYSFKNSLKDHLNCSSLRSSGHIHLKAKQYQMAKLKTDEKKLDACANIVAAALEACKTKAAALSFEHLLGLISFCGGEIGSIGHGRLELHVSAFIRIRTENF
ncbi:MAG: hypothetical protein AAFY76_05890 [Cyanobacteria bacterium J06649_11]